MALSSLDLEKLLAPVVDIALKNLLRFGLYGSVDTRFGIQRCFFLLHLLCCSQSILLLVGFLVEIFKEEEEEDGIWQREAHGPAWVVAFGVQQLGLVYKDDAELDLNDKR